MESKFVIGNVEPFIGGGLFIQIMFIDHPNDVYSAWVYSFVDEEKKEPEFKSGYSSKQELLSKMKNMPEMKLW